MKHGDIGEFFTSAKVFWDDTDHNFVKTASGISVYVPDFYGATSTRAKLRDHLDFHRSTPCKKYGPTIRAIRTPIAAPMKKPMRIIACASFATH